MRKLAKVRTLNTPQDWADAITEMNDILTQFRRTMELALYDLSSQSSIQKRQSFCSSQSASVCSYPCQVGGRLRPSCAYQTPPPSSACPKPIWDIA